MTQDYNLLQELAYLGEWKTSPHNSLHFRCTRGPFEYVIERYFRETDVDLEVWYGEKRLSEHGVQPKNVASTMKIMIKTMEFLADEESTTEAARASSNLA